MPSSFGLGVNKLGGGAHKLEGTVSKGGTKTNGWYIVKDSIEQQVQKTISISSTALTTLAITTSSLANGTEGTAYSATPACSGSYAPITWSVTGLPSGISLSSTSTGNISGTPTTYGTFSVTWTVSDSKGRSVSKTISLTIVVALVSPPLPYSFSKNGTNKSFYVDKTGYYMTRSTYSGITHDYLIHALAGTYMTVGGNAFGENLTYDNGTTLRAHIEAAVGKTFTILSYSKNQSM